MEKEQNQPDEIKCTIIIIIFIIGLFGNLINLKIFANKQMKKIITFRYFYYLAWIDLIIIVLFSTEYISLYGFLINLETYSNIMFKILIYFKNCLTQISIWIFVSSSINNAFVSIKQTNGKRLQNREKTIKIIIILICFLLALFNLHYLILLNIQIEFDIEKKSINKSVQHLFNLTNKQNRNSLNSILTKLKVFDHMFSNESNEIFVAKEIKANNYNYGLFLNQLTTWINLILFTVLPFILNTISILIISNQNKKQRDQKLKRFNLTLIRFFIIANLIYNSIEITNNFMIAYFKITSFKIITDRQNGQFIIQIVLLIKHSCDFVIYSISMKKYRKMFIALFQKRNAVLIIQLEQI